MKNRSAVVGIVCGIVGAVAGSLAMTAALSGHPWPAVLLVAVWIVLLTYAIRTRPKHQCVPPEAYKDDEGRDWACPCGQRWKLSSVGWDGYYPDLRWIKVYDLPEPSR